MYSAEDIKKRIEERRQEVVNEQMKLVEAAINNMYEHCETFTSVSFKKCGENIQREVRDKLIQQGFEIRCEYESNYKISIPEDEIEPLKNGD